jgi:hypothetical protein
MSECQTQDSYREVGNCVEKFRLQYGGVVIEKPTPVLHSNLLVSSKSLHSITLYLLGPIF